MAPPNAPAAADDVDVRPPASHNLSKDSIPDVVELPSFEDCVILVDADRSSDGDEDKTKKEAAQDEASATLLASESFLLSYEEDPSFAWAFCCLKCKCSLRRKAKFRVEDDLVETVAIGNGLEGCLWHRRCCHGLLRTRKTWTSPVERATSRFGVVEGRVSGSSPVETTSHHQVLFHVEASAESHDRKMSKVTNAALKGVNPVSAVLIEAVDYPIFTEYDRLLDRCDAGHVKRARLEISATVLDLFAGTGAGLVALKRQGISVGWYVYVEHCPVAKHVFRWNHDPAYNPGLADEGIRFLYYCKFEDVAHDLDKLMRKLGPIDIVFAAPPCVDFTRINATAKGVAGEQGRLTPMTVDLITRIRFPGKKRRTLFFVVENVTDGEVVEALEPLGVPPVKLQAALFSPTFRARHFWTNVRPNEEDFTGTEAASASLDSCLDDQYMSPLTLADDAPDQVVNKALTFLASKGRHNPDDFLVYRLNDDGSNSRRTLTGVERGRIMGFPEGYASKALAELFHKLSQVHAYTSMDQLIDPEELEKYCSLRDTAVLQDFRGEPVQCSGFDFSTGVYHLKLYPPRVKPDHEDESRLCYDQEAYEKRLWGNAWNVPSMEKLLTPLKPLFASKTYEGYPYSFRWESSES